jgi:hypothetical protein
MTSSPRTLRGSLSQLQRTVARFYSHLQQRFEGNVLVSGMWAAMGNELQSQVENIKKLPPSFWHSLQDEEKEVARAIGIVLPPVSGGSLHACLTQTLDLEEPVILQVYAPLIRRLRSNWIELALDFYILVKAHIARLAQSIQLFSGDPALSLRCAMLLQNFEKEVQGPALAEPPPPRAGKKRKARRKPPAKRVRVRGSAAKKKARSLEKLSKRAKPLIRKIKLAGRRARR